MFLKTLQNPQENTRVRVSFLKRSQFVNFVKKETLAQVFSCEFCEVFKNILFYRTLPVAASVMHGFSTRKFLEIEVSIRFFVILLSIYKKNSTSSAFNFI